MRKWPPGGARACHRPLRSGQGPPSGSLVRGGNSASLPQPWTQGLGHRVGGTKIRLPVCGLAAAFPGKTGVEHHALRPGAQLCPVLPGSRRHPPRLAQPCGSADARQGPDLHLTTRRGSSWARGPPSSAQLCPARGPQSWPAVPCSAQAPAEALADRGRGVSLLLSSPISLGLGTEPETGGPGPEVPRHGVAVFSASRFPSL